MIALHVEYLTDRVAATDVADSEAVEWPPHPGRLFCALVAALREGELGVAEETALQWLEKQPPPAIALEPARLPASEAEPGPQPRTVLEVYVPVNDTSRGEGLLPEKRSRQPRSFPTFVPVQPRVIFCWQQVDDAEARQYGPALDRLARNVTYLGHSSSLVQAWLGEPPPQVTWVPSDHGELALRVPTPGRLRQLDAAWSADKRPSFGLYHAYARAASPVQQDEVFESAFSDVLVWEPSDTAAEQDPTGEPNALLFLPGLLALTRAMRQTMIHLAGQEVPEILHGHAADGSPTRRTHVAYLPLANVGHPESDSRIFGIALAMPRNLPAEEREVVLRASQQLRELRMGQAGRWLLRQATGSTRKRSLRLGPYLGPACEWASVTPMEFDRYPKDKPGERREDIVAAACRAIGLPDPIGVRVEYVSCVPGAPRSDEFEPTRQGRLWAHVAVQFDVPVRGPVILGAGRYYGMGLCRALDLAGGEA